MINGILIKIVVLCLLKKKNDCGSQRLVTTYIPHGLSANPLGGIFSWNKFELAGNPKKPS